jgi:hypothetical protein
MIEADEADYCADESVYAEGTKYEHDRSRSV